MFGDSPYYSGGDIEFTSATITTTSTTGAVDKTLTFLAAELLALLPVAPYCKDKKPKCKAKKCNKRTMFKKKCQATCAAHCLEDPENKKCPKDKENKKCNPPKGKPVDCTSKKTRKMCPLSCPCVLPAFDCYTKEVWSDEKIKWCCDNMQIGCLA